MHSGRFKSVRFLLTDTKVARSTKVLVAGVAEKIKADPADGKRVLDAIQGISDSAIALLTNTEVPRATLIKELSVSSLLSSARSCADITGFPAHRR